MPCDGFDNLCNGTLGDFCGPHPVGCSAVFTSGGPCFEFWLTYIWLKGSSKLVYMYCLLYPCLPCLQRILFCSRVCFWLAKDILHLPACVPLCEHIRPVFDSRVSSHGGPRAGKGIPQRPPCQIYHLAPCTQQYDEHEAKSSWWKGCPLGDGPQTFRGPRSRLCHSDDTLHPSVAKQLCTG